MAHHSQGDLFSPIRNHGVFSSHWLEHRLSHEPDWSELADAADEALEELGELWKVQRKRVEKYGDEQGLEQGFIQPVMTALGWRLKYQTHLQGRKPDYALFLSDADLDTALSAERESPDFWAPAAVVADAKKWDLSLDKPVKVAGKREYPPEQIEWYLDRSKKPFGVLTNGRLWRLVPREPGPHQRRYQTYFEVDLAAILDARSGTDLQQRGAAAEDFRRFFLFFGPSGFAERDGLKSLLRRAVEGSSNYRVGVSEGLKREAFDALCVHTEGILDYEPSRLEPTRDLDRCRGNCFVLRCGQFERLSRRGVAY